jgi:hypothetical protein
MWTMVIRNSINTHRHLWIVYVCSTREFSSGGNTSVLYVNTTILMLTFPKKTHILCAIMSHNNPASHSDDPGFKYRPKCTRLFSDSSWYSSGLLRKRRDGKPRFRRSLRKPRLTIGSEKEWTQLAWVQLAVCSPTVLPFPSTWIRNW